MRTEHCVFERGGENSRINILVHEISLMEVSSCFECFQSYSLANKFPHVTLLFRVEYEELNSFDSSMMCTFNDTIQNWLTCSNAGDPCTNKELERERATSIFALNSDHTFRVRRSFNSHAALKRCTSHKYQIYCPALCVISHLVVTRLTPICCLA